VLLVDRKSSFPFAAENPSIHNSCRDAAYILMSWIQTFTGRKFSPFEPRMEDIDIRDIAHALSLQARFNGHTLSFYSVAEHSVRVSLSLVSEVALWGLLHDAAEAYVGDLPRPLKRNIPEFEAIEIKLLEKIISRFGLSWPMPPEVAHADDILLVTECRDLMSAPPEPWNIPAEPLAGKIVPLGCEAAEEQFLTRFKQLRRGG
jgi:hypothetical protein